MPKGVESLGENLTGQTNYEYNEEVEIRQGDGLEVKYVYDVLERLTKVTGEDKTTIYDYGEAGNMTKINRKDGTISNLTYRLSNRVEEIMYCSKKGKLVPLTATTITQIISFLKK
ncbi:RHS repeat domain-containing protein [Enterococcus durans]|nr:RHS repeat domain-containing protein [Enterococcus durans]